MRKSSVKTKIPSSILRELDRLIMEDKLTIDELHAFVVEKVANPPSRSAIGRYAASEKATKQALKESREIARGIAQELGPESVESEQGRILVEMLRSFVFKDLMNRVSDPDAKFDAGEIAKITRSVRDLAQAMSLEQDFAKKIREEERKRIETKVKNKVDKLCGRKDLQKLSDEELKEKIAELAAI